MNELISPANILSPDVGAAFTTRVAGSIKQKRDAAAGLFGVSSAKVYIPDQKHTDTVHLLEDDMRPVVADAVLTRRHGLLIGVQVADCIPLLMYDPGRGLIAAIHAGWRGTASEIVLKTVRTMTGDLGSAASDILVAIGPGIGGCCYEVGADVAGAVSGGSINAPFISGRGERFMLDLAQANKIQAESAGIPPGNIWSSAACTCCDPECFYSYRRDGNLAGRQGGFIIMW